MPRAADDHIGHLSAGGCIGKVFVIYGLHILHHKALYGIFNNKRNYCLINGIRLLPDNTANRMLSRTFLTVIAKKKTR